MMLCAALITAAFSACSPGNSPLESFSAGIELSMRQATVADGESLELTVYSRARAGGRRVTLDPSQVSWSSSSPDVATVARGLVSAHRPGQVTIIAASPEGWSASANLSIQAVPSALEFLFSDLPEGEVGIPLSGPVSVRVTDRHGTPMSGVDVQFAPINGAGTVSPRIQKSGTDGTLQTFWTLGTRAGNQALRASLVSRPDRWSELPATARPGPVASVEILPPVDTIPGSSAVVVRAKLDDFYGNSVPGVPLSWMVISGGGSVSSSSDSTDENGGMEAEWILGNPAEEQVVGARPGGGNGGGLGTLSVDLRGVFVSPAEAFIEMRESVQLTAEVRDRNGGIVSDADVRWRSSDQGVASVSSEGLVHGIAPGAATITASANGRSGSAEITVNALAEPGPESEPHADPEPDNETEPTPDEEDPTAEENETASDDRTDDGGWTSNENDLYADGEPTATRTITVTPDSASIEVEGSMTLIAVERWPSGEVNHDAVFTWSSSDSKVATVDGSGRVAGLSAGRVTVTARRSGRSGSAEIHVLSRGDGTENTTQSEGTISSVTLSPSEQSLQEDETIHIQAVVRDAQGNEVEATALAWSSSNASIVRVEPNGTGAYVTSGSTGSATVLATLDGVTGSANFTVSGTTSSASGLIPAFPGAEGYGAAALNTCDRRNPHVFAVTNLNDSGAGSFRQAMADAEAAPQGDLKVITFRVGGYIRTTSRIIFEGNCLYIAGQTAPGDGVTIRGRGLEFQRDARDIVIRFLRIRLGTGAADDGILIRKGENYVFDHLSTSWTDRTLIRFSRTQIGRSGPIRNVTIQRSLLGESLAAHPTGLQIGGEGDTDDGGTQAGWRDVTHFSLHGNALVSNNHRNINARGLYIESVNNVVHNWNLDGGQTGREAIVDWVNNYIQKGPMSRDSYVPIGVGTGHVTSDPYYEPSIHLSGNLSIGGGGNRDQNTSTTASNWDDPTMLIDWYHNNTGGDLLRFRRNSRIQQLTSSPTFPVTVRDAYSARDRVLQSVGADRGLDCRGAWRTRQDTVDQRLIQDIISKGGWSSGGGPSNEGAVGGFPSLSSGSACTDSSGNGIPDLWLADRGLDVNNPSVAGRIGSGGYSYLEHYLNGTNP